MPFRSFVPRASSGLFRTPRQGSRDEAPNESGLSHFLEHFVFRGTRARTGPDETRTSVGRSPRDIAIETDLLGGDVDAWTDREATSYSVEVAADLLPRAADLVMDLVAWPALDATQMERERSVIRKEIRGLEEDSEELWAKMAKEQYAEEEKRMAMTQSPVDDLILADAGVALPPPNTRAVAATNDCPIYAAHGSARLQDPPRFDNAGPRLRAIMFL